MKNDEKHDQSHFILPPRLACGIGISLLLLTGVTVWIAQIDLGGRWNFFLAMVVATFKASLVVLYFMGLKFDQSINGLLFGSSFIILGIFVLLLFSDFFYRQEGIYLKKSTPPWAVASQSGPSLFKKPWVLTPELVEHGQKTFSIQCATCHGPQGRGDGPAAAALKPPPRNFHETIGWKNGRRPTMVYKTLKEGIPGSSMASYSNLSSDDLWGLVHYVLSLHGQPEVDSPEDFKRVGLDPSQEGGGTTAEVHVPIDFILKRMAVPE